MLPRNPFQYMTSTSWWGASRQAQTAGRSTKHLTSPLQKHQGNERQDRGSVSPEESRRCDSAKCSVRSWNRKRTLGENWGVRNESIVQLFFFKFIYSFLRETETVWCEQGRGRERRRERIPSRLCTISTEPDMGPKPTGLTRLSHPGTPSL